MSSQMQGTVRVQAENIGGIDDTDITLSREVSILTGRNATNRTSLLQAIMAALGSNEVSLKGDADEGMVELEIDGETYSRRLSRTADGIRFSGDPYLDDPTIADLFSFLTETNEARQAVARGDDLRELLMRPVDTAAIRADIERLQAEKADIDDELDHLDDLKDRLPELEARLTEIDDEIADKKSELADIEAEIDAADSDVDESQDHHEELEERLTELREARSELEDVRYEIESERESLSALNDELDETESELAALPEETRDEELLETEMDRLRERKRSVDSTITQLQNVIEFNEEMLDGDRPEFIEATDGDAEGAPTDKLLPEAESVVCWTCGSTVEREAISATLDHLRALRQDRIEERSSITDELEQVKTEQAEQEELQRQRQQLTSMISELEEEITNRNDRIESLESQREELEATIESLEETVESLREQEYSQILDLHADANKIEFEIGQLEREREEIESELDSIESELDRRGDLADERQRVREALTDRRTRIKRIEEEAIEEFNEHMDRVLDILDYENIDRIWIERTATSDRHELEQGSFDLHVIRSTDGGTTYEDTVDHLSESEREVTGLVFALAGYLVHDVYELVPFMLLDSLEALDSERIAHLVEYFSDSADQLVVALLPEDSAALDERYHRITEI